MWNFSKGKRRTGDKAKVLQGKILEKFSDVQIKVYICCLDLGIKESPWKGYEVWTLVQCVHTHWMWVGNCQFRPDSKISLVSPNKSFWFQELTASWQSLVSNRRSWLLPEHCLHCVPKHWNTQLWLSSGMSTISPKSPWTLDEMLKHFVFKFKLKVAYVCCM